MRLRDRRLDRPPPDARERLLGVWRSTGPVLRDGAGFDRRDADCWHSTTDAPAAPRDAARRNDSPVGLHSSRSATSPSCSTAPTPDLGARTRRPVREPVDGSAFRPGRSCNLELFDLDASMESEWAAGCGARCATANRLWTIPRASSHNEQWTGVLAVVHRWSPVTSARSRSRAPTT